MSTNFHIRIEREILVLKTQAKEIQSEYCEILWQTSTKETHQIMSSPDPIEAYFDWVRDRNIVETREIFEDEMFAGLDESPIGTYEVNVSEDHITTTREWLNKMDQAGFTIIPEAW